MGIYNRSSSRARRKGAKKRVRRTRETARKPAKKKKKIAAVRRSRGKPKRLAKRAVKKRTRKVATAKKRARARSKTPRAPVRKKRAAAKKIAAKRRAAPKKATKKTTPKKRRAAPRKKPPATKRRAAPKKRRKAPSRAAIAKENRRLRAEIKRIKGAEQTTRKRTKKSRPKRAIKKRKRVVEQARIEQVFAAHEYPHETPAKALAARNADWAEKKSRFRELFEKAAAAGQLPRPERVKRRIDTERSRGEQTVVRIRRRTTPRSVQQMLYKIEDRVRGRLPGPASIWLAKLTLTSMGEKLVGSGNRLLVVRGGKDQAAETFYVQSFDSTGAWNTLQGMLEQLSAILEDYASLRRNVVYVHSIKISNFERKKP